MAFHGMILSWGSYQMLLFGLLFRIPGVVRRGELSEIIDVVFLTGWCKSEKRSLNENMVFQLHC